MRIGRIAKPIIMFTLIGAAVNVLVAWTLQYISQSRPIRVEEEIEGGAGGSGRVVWLVTLVERVGNTRIKRRSHNLDGKPILTEAWKRREDEQAQRKMNRMIPYWSAVRTVQPAPSAEGFPSRAHHGTELAAGWPFHSLWSEHSDFALGFHLNIARFPETFEIDGKVARWTETHDGESSEGRISLDMDALHWGWLVRAEAKSTPIPWPHPRHTGYDIVILSLRPIWPGFLANTLLYGGLLWLVFTIPGAIRRNRRERRGCCAACNYDLRGAAHERCPECGAAVRR